MRSLISSASLLPVLLFGIAQPAKADTTYVYTGTPYDHVVGNGYNTSESVTGYFTIAGQLNPNMVQTPENPYPFVLPVDFSFSDGRQTITEADSTFYEFAPITTDANSNIVLYEIEIQGPEGSIFVANVFTRIRAKANQSILRESR